MGMLVTGHHVWGRAYEHDIEPNVSFQDHNFSIFSHCFEDLVVSKFDKVEVWTNVLLWDLPRFKFFRSINTTLLKQSINLDQQF